MTVVPLARRSGGDSHPEGPEKSRYLAALDIGSSKVCCMIAEVVPDRRPAPGDLAHPRLKVRGVGHQASRGVKAGVIVNLDEAERAIRVAVDQAERMAKVAVSQVYVNVSGGRPRCTGYSASLETGGAAVDEHHLNEVTARAYAKCDPEARAILHATPVRYSLDDARGVLRPLGMFGETLAVDLNVLTVDRGALRNLALAVERCHLGVAGLVIAPYAAARAALVEDELDLGATVIDMGGATTSFATFEDGALAHADMVPVGGQHITNDLAKGLSTHLVHAERLKTLSGSALAAASDEREVVAVPLLGELGLDTVQKIPRSMLTGIIRPRLEETFELVRDRLRKVEGAERGGRIVLTGGGSQLNGARELAAQIFERTVRVATPRGLSGLPEIISTPPFTVVAGLLRYAMNPDRQLERLARASRGAEAGYFTRVGQWIRESF
jgi:cell division protein FtsA